MAEFIIEQDDSFTVVTNTILRDKTLSMSAKGLLSTMLSLPPEWDYSFNGLVKICKEGKCAVRNTINELKEAGYNTTRLRKEKLLGENSIQYIREGKPISAKALDKLCMMLDCQPGNILKYIDDTQK